MTVKEKVKQIAYDRRGKCPAYWHSIDYWGEADEGCTLNRDIFEFCSLSLLPNFIMKPYVKYEQWKEEKYWDKLYQEDCKKWESESDDQQ